MKNHNPITMLTIEFGMWDHENMILGLSNGIISGKKSDYRTDYLQHHITSKLCNIIYNGGHKKSYWAIGKYAFWLNRKRYKYLFKNNPSHPPFHIPKSSTHPPKKRERERVIKGKALLTVGYTIFGNKSYSYKMYS